MPDLSILTKIVSLYGESIQLLRNRLEPPRQEDLTNEGTLSKLVRELMVIIDEIIEKKSYSYCTLVQDLIEQVAKSAKSLPDFKKIESSGILLEVRSWEEKGVHSDDDKCEAMLISFKSLLGELFA